MRTEEQLKERMKDYVGAKYIYREYGYVAWQVSTGENIEIIFIEVNEKGRGYATKLITEMCTLIKPYHSVFVFRLKSNETAGHFYRKLGFTETVIPGLYAGDDAVLGVVKYDDLCRNLSIK
jgi:ribosomal protein S18 acetylase RimI-like enzyme